MRGKSQTCTVKEGRIRVTCPRCEKKRYLTVTPGVRKKSVRCSCGLSTLCTLNHRGALRESTCSKAVVLLKNGRECPVYLCDISLGGLGFLLPFQYLRSIAGGQEIMIKYRATAGSIIQRKIEVKSVTSNRIGAQFVDQRRPPSL